MKEKRVVEIGTLVVKWVVAVGAVKALIPTVGHPYELSELFQAASTVTALGLLWGFLYGKKTGQPNRIDTAEARTSSAVKRS